MRLFHFAAREHCLRSIKQQRLKLSNFDDLNDPFELLAISFKDQAVRKAINDSKAFMASRYSLLCCSKTWKSPLLWSHYADRHRGAALVLEVPDKCVINVEYTKSRLQVAAENAQGYAPDQSSLGLKLIRTKYEQWVYEDEARVLFKKEETYRDDNLTFFRLDDDIRITGVIVGPLCTIDDREVAEILEQGQQIEITRSRLAFKTYDIVGTYEKSTKVFGLKQ